MLQSLQRVKKRKFGKYYITNQNIRHPELRIISPEGENLGVMNRIEALEAAKKKGLDLILITNRADPPVARLDSFKKFLYQQKKVAGTQKRDDRRLEGKTLRLGPHIDDNDLRIRVERAQEFLAAGTPVRFEMLFKGRAISHPEVGKAKFEAVKKALTKEARVEQDITRKGRVMTMVLGPK